MNPPTLPDYIKPGAFVKLRDGSKARIYATDGTATYPIHGAILFKGSWECKVWHSTYYLDEGHDDVYDIISAWTDTPDCSKLWPLLPPWIKWIAQDEDGDWRGHMYKPDLMSSWWDASATNDDGWKWYITIPKEYHPIFEGDWKNSLVERPQ